MRLMMGRVKMYIRKKGLMVNVEKSKIMKFGREGERRKKVRWRWGGEVEAVKSYKYLGFIFLRNGKQGEQVRDRLKKGGR